MTRRKQPAGNGSKNDAIQLLTDDHKKVKKLFREFEGIKGGNGAAKEKSEVVRQICAELTIHTRVEEEIFYPVLRESIDETDLMDEADVEHAGAKILIAQLERMNPGDDHYDAIVSVLGEYIDHHVKEEHEEMFPKAKRAKLDMVELAARITERKAQLRGEPTASARETGR